jgi:hypothetical protein
MVCFIEGTMTKALRLEFEILCLSASYLYLLTACLSQFGKFVKTSDNYVAESICSHTHTQEVTNYCITSHPCVITYISIFMSLEYLGHS